MNPVVIRSRELRESVVLVAGYVFAPIYQDTYHKDAQAGPWNSWKLPVELSSASIATVRKNGDEGYWPSSS